MNGIYSAKFMNEASCTLADKVIKRPVSETYLFSSVNILREMNSLINNKTKQLYISIAEAESKEEENKLFASYFYEFKNIFESFAERINEMKSRMIINIENKVETWDDLIKDDAYISAFDTEFNYSGWDFTNITNCNYPRLNLYKAYQKEFDSIGLLMQDKSIDATPTTKMKIIASVMNSFSAYANNENWARDFIKDMVDVPNDSDTISYSQAIYNSLRSKKEIKVDKCVAYTYKDNLSDYESVIETCEKMCDNLLNDLSKVTENISSYMFRNEDKKLKIKTPTDGVLDRDYRLDTYSMNQLNLFIKSKCNQMKKILNIYAIAVGIKLDTAVDYIDQCISILKTVKGYDDEKNMNNPANDEKNTNNPDTEKDDMPDVNEPTDSTEEPSDTQDQDEPDDYPEDSNPDESKEESDSDYDDDFGDDDFDYYDDESDSDDDSDDDGDDDSDDDFYGEGKKKEEIKPVAVGKDASNEFEEAYLFESEIFELEMLSEMYNMHSSVRSILEEETPAAQSQGGENANAQPAQTSGDANGDNKSSQTNDAKQDTNSNVKALANKAKEPNIIMKLINKLKELWKKFKEFVTIGSKAKIEYLRKNAKYIKVPVTGKVGLEYKYDLAFINSIQIPDLNYEAMKDNLESTDKFTQSLSFYGDDNKGKSISEYIKDKALGEPQEATEDLKSLVPSVEKAYDFCIDYPNKVKALDRQMETFKKAEQVIMKEIKESATSNSFNDYFLELDTSQDTSTETKREHLNNYFRVCSQIITAEMTVYQKLFNEFYLYCKWHIVKAGGSSDDATKKDENADNGKTENNQQNNNQNQQNNTGKTVDKGNGIKANYTRAKEKIANMN